MARIKGYTGVPSQETIDANILDKERKMVACLFKAARWNRSGATIDDWLIKADVQALEIQTLKSKCPNKVYDFVDESLEKGCREGNGIGFMRIMPTDNPEGCPIFKIATSSQLPPPLGEFSYCEFRTREFTNVIGTPPDCGGLTYLVNNGNFLVDGSGNRLYVN